MLPYPNEDEHIESLSTALVKEFDFARRIYGHWLRSEKDRFLEASSLPRQVLHLSMMLDVQMIRLFRSIVEESKRG